MPAAGMRRTTRVFGLVTKGVDSPRVLRSGRRLWPDSGEPKAKKGNEGDDRYKPLPPLPAAKTAIKGSGGDGYRKTVAAAAAKTKREEAGDNASRKDYDMVMTRHMKRNRSLKEEKKSDDVAMTRRRKRNRSLKDEMTDDDVVMTRHRKKSCSLKEEKKDGVVDGRFGVVYSRKRKRKRLVCAESSELSRKIAREIANTREDEEEGGGSRSHSVLSFVVKPCSDWFSCLLLLVLRYIRRVRVTLEQLAAFVLSEPICGAFASTGIQFLQGPPTPKIGICQFFGITEFVPLLSVDFSAVPHYFKYLHSVVLLKSMFRSFFLVHNLVNVHSDVDDVDLEIDFPELQNEQKISCNAFKREPSVGGTVTPNVIQTNDSLSLHSSVNSSRLAGRNRQYRTRGIQRRRSSLRRRKARNPSVVSLRKSNGAVASDLMGGRKSNIPLSGVASSKKLRSSANSCTNGSLKEASSVMLDSTEGLDSSLCSANILVTESDQCYRVEGAIVALEMSSSGEWLFYVKKDGLTRCTFKAEKVMRPCSSNRFTHVIMFSLDNGWKLEFANRQDWVLFKHLYKECYDRNIPASVAKFIPVPGVHEVPAYSDGYNFTFHRPDTYISANGDELSRAMTRITANYDMDSEDEEWLSKFNNEFQEHVSEDNFELIIDALEKVYYYNPDYSFDEKFVAYGCQDLGSQEVVEAVYSYWMRKRKLKRTFLLRVFQCHQSKKAPVIPKPLLRKRRSFKRQPSQFGRGNQPSVLKAFAAEQDALEENAMLRIEEAKASAKIAMELAVEKRKRAQSLAENVDLAIYKATMLIRIAEAAQAAESANAVAGYFLD